MIKSIFLILTLTLCFISSNAEQEHFFNKTINSSPYIASLDDLIKRLMALPGVSDGCKNNIKTQAMTCMSRAYEKWKDESNAKKGECCGLWMTMDCSKDESAKNGCSTDEVTKVWAALENDRNDPDCSDYKYHSNECNGSISVKLTGSLAILLAIVSMFLFK